MSSNSTWLETNSATLAFVFEGLLLLIVGILGALGNTAAIIVFSQEQLQRNFHALMVALASFDLMYVLVSILIFAMPQFSDKFVHEGLYHRVLPWLLPLAQVGLTGSIYCTMGVTLERYLTVCHPFYHVSHHWMTAKKYVLPIVVFAVVYNTPKFMELRTRHPTINIHLKNDSVLEVTEDNDNFELLMLNQSRGLDRLGVEKDEVRALDLIGYGINPTHLRLNGTYIQLYCVWLNLIVNGLLPFLMVVAMNALILHRLQRMSSESDNESGGNNGRHLSQARVSHVGHQHKHKEVLLAKVSLGIVFVFIVCHSVKWIPNIYELLAMDPEGDLVWPIWVELVTHVSHLLTTFNSSVNFYIYLAKHPRLLTRNRESGQAQPRRDAHTRVTQLEPKENEALL